MSKKRPGRPRTFAVEREPNGRIKRPTLAQLAEVERNARLAEIAFVLGQPHRRYAKAPEDVNLITALGRYADRTGLPKDHLQAGLDYRELWRKSFVRQDIEGVYRDPSQGPLGGPPSADDEARYAERTRIVVAARVSAEHAALRRDGTAFAAMRHLVIDDQDIPPSMWAAARLGLYWIGVELGIFPHPSEEVTKAIDAERVSA
jgi:hypothetical protein